MNCKPGDRAIVIKSKEIRNIGKIVDVIKEYDPNECKIILLQESEQIWLCESLGSELVWPSLGGFENILRMQGPIPDECLVPLIDDEPELHQHATPEIKPTEFA
ncbi:hypothetical protein [Polynucleobacter sp. UK-Kesae-W10]|uniref:hypothetical protein n=1 Tax=Polynucleobacter sp. UK-Kesae-W10 TaxID=1819738 RepID=UPI001C0BF18E|nr:hypothetical protein [Polynucleobacter sp. UK-Kesae-W10]MBU3577515.1 hypothetical protein [Polynucleobacter sp. UK-Kesae-W10]